MPAIFYHKTNTPMRRGPTTGIALISVILTVALIATISAGMIAKQHVEIRRTANLIHAYKAYEYALGVESWAIVLLLRDLANQKENGTEHKNKTEGNGIDHYGEDWARPLPPTEITGGMLTGRIEDLQARFNLNNLRNKVQDSGRGEMAWRNDVMRFQALLRRCKREPHLVWAVVDWIDGGNRDEPSPGGAEDYTYLGLELPYRAANRPMANPSELVLVQGFDDDAYRCLLPFIATLPEGTPINVNTASVPVLMTIAAGITETQGRQIVKWRQEEPYESVEAFFEHLETIGVPVPEPKDKFDKNSLAVASNYYLVVATTRIGNTRLDLFSRIKRQENGKPRVLSRSRGGW